MRRLLAVAAAAGLTAASIAGWTLTQSDASQQNVASEKCVYTQDTYVLGIKVLSAGKFCVPWI